jgi:NAD(P)-dependent dehydrogenase (short-subunit alcohol dehydrogenase family)
MTDENTKTAIVTGGSRGIGRAIVEALLGDGWNVWFCSRSPDTVAQALDDLAERGTVAGQAVDVRDQEAVDAWVAQVVEVAGHVDLLVNNAGLGYFAPVDEIDGDAWRDVLRTNLDGAFYFTHAVAPHMRRRGEGWILNVASLAGKNPFAGGAAYNASKFGMLGFSEATMLDLRQDGIRVAAIMPGSVDTAFFDGLREERSWMLAPEDIARTVMDLLRFPGRALPSRIEIRPSRPPKK